MKIYLPNIIPPLRLSAIVLFCAIITTTTFPSLAKTTSPPKLKSNLKIRWKPPTPPSVIGIPGNRAQGGATRGCQPYRGITALVPISPQKIAWGQSISARPTIWLNAPQGLAKDVEMEITVQAENGQPLAKQLFRTKTKVSSGVVSVPFPAAGSLDINRTYRWEIAIYCDTDEQIDRPFLLQGQVKRIAPPATLTPAKSDLEQVHILAENGIWYDALTLLGNRLRQTKDRDLTIAWSQLVKSAGLSGSDRLRDCCQLDSSGTKQP
jgi:hypothetical protein